MTAELIDGKAIAQAIRDEIKAEVDQRVAQGLPRPGLGVLLVGDNVASAAYVRMKTRACAEAGFHSEQIDLDSSVSQDDVIQEIRRFNADPAIHGILVQLPLPGHMDVQVVLDNVTPEKDVDGLHPVNVGMTSSGRGGFWPCTPLGVRELLLRSGVQTAGASAVVLGRSDLVGRPMALLLMRRAEGGDATVTVCHSRSRDLVERCRQADILVAAIGRGEFVTANMVKPGAVVIDVGINRLDDPAAAKGYRLVGDVDFEAVRQVASRITPVPGGVGPMTIAMLLSNTLDSARLHDRKAAPA
ncbi:MAG: bifunctional methylenetetrahydrofolate dehydrogenase/methenyltetrahydrofolate cyclohydrolase FolD [Sumerlaeia bacterium]